MTKRQNPPTPAPRSSGKTLSDFRAAHDKSFIVPLRIRAGLKALGDGWEYEVQFMKLCGLSQTDFSCYREEFETYCVETKGHNAKRVWCGTPTLAEKLRAMV